MIREINRDILSLRIPSERAGKEDRQVAKDLLDTLMAHADSCVGMAANMIGVHKNIIAFLDEDRYTVMFNPVITMKTGEYDTEEGCLSLTGKRKTKRHRLLTVSYETETGEKKTGSYFGFTAEIIEHEIDHLHGVII